MAATRTRIRRRAVRRRQAPRVRRQASGAAHAVRQDARAQAEGEGGLMIGGARDPAETAADRMAAHVLAGGAAGPATTSAPGAVHRKCAACAGGGAPCPACSSDSAEKTVERQAAAAPVTAPGAKAAPASPGASKAIGAMGAGRPLARAERAFFEPRFGRDLSAVRVHQDTAADRAARAIDARAFTRGRDIAFAKGGLDRATMAHELAHVAMSEPGPARRAPLRRLPACETGKDCPRRDKGEYRWARKEGFKAGVMTSPKHGFLVWNFPIGSAKTKVLAGNATWKRFLGTLASDRSIWTVRGFADCIGTAKKNAELRATRPLNVVSMLPSTLPGSFLPSPAPGTCIADNTTKENRAFNRAVLFEKSVTFHDFPPEILKVKPPKKKASRYVACYDGKTVTVSKNGKTASCAAVTSSSGPTPTGDYCIRQQGAAQTKGHSKWFLLEPLFKTSRSRMHLHPGSVSAGCVTVTDTTCFGGLAKILNTSGTVTEFGHDGCPPGNTDCKKWGGLFQRVEPRRKKTCVGRLKVTSAKGGCAGVL